MTDEAFERANNKMHPVEEQWHYARLTKYGFTSETEPQKGFVRGYIYTHPDGREIRAFTGLQADYWISPTAMGYPMALDAHLREWKS